MHMPTDKRLEAGDLVLGEITPLLNGQFIQLCRTIILGQPRPLIVEKYDMLVHALEPSTDQHEVVELGPPIEVTLGQGGSGRSQQHAVPTGERCQGRLQWFDHHHHPRASPEGSVVDLSMWPQTVLTQVHDLDRRRAGVDGASDDAHAQGAPKE